jgi:type I restriction enzyme S subunit
MKADELRKSILQLAIQGKLVKQDPNDEPASILIEKIREEKQRLIKEGKIKKDKTESFIYKAADNSYYESICRTYLP